MLKELSLYDLLNIRPNSNSAEIKKVNIIIINNSILSFF